MDAEQPQEIEISELKSIERYFWVLLDSYPQPINQTELAKRAGVTRAAISRIKDILNKICDLKSLAYERKLVLKKEINTGMSLFMYVVLFKEPNELKSYITSQYFIDVIYETDLYNKMNSRFEIYNFENYFSNDDFKWVLNFIIKKIIFHDPEIADGIIYIKFEDEHVKDSYITTLPINMQLIYSIFYDSSLLFINKNEDFIKLLELRDKLYYFITNNKGIYTGVLKDSVSRLEIEDQEDMALVEKASNIIFDHVFKKALKNITLHTYSEALKMDIPLNIEYKKLGSLFQI